MWGEAVAGWAGGEPSVCELQQQEVRAGNNKISTWQKKGPRGHSVTKTTRVLCWLMVNVVTVKHDSAFLMRDVLSSCKNTQPCVTSSRNLIMVGGHSNPYRTTEEIIYLRALCVCVCKITAGRIKTLFNLHVGFIGDEWQMCFYFIWADHKWKK